MIGPPPEPAEGRPLTRREAAIAASAIAAFVGLVILQRGGAILLSQPFWLDEWLTVLVSTTASPLAVLANLRHGADGGSGLYHLVAWAVGGVIGRLTPTLLHSVSLAFVLGTMWIGYIVLRRRFAPLPSVAGVLAAGSHQVLVAQAFQARFYPLWIFCCVLFAWALGSTHRRTAKVAVAAVLLTASHWYGIFTVALMTLGAVAAHGRNWRGGLRYVAPSSAALLTLAAMLPLALGQRAATSVPTWIHDFTWEQFRLIAELYWSGRVLMLAGGALVLGVIVTVAAGRHRSVLLRATRTLADPPVMAMGALILMPLVLTALSLGGQPSMLHRYGLPGALGWAPLVALAFDTLGRWPSLAFILALVHFWGVSVQAEVNGARYTRNRVAEEARLIGTVWSMGQPLVFLSIHDMYPHLAGSRGRGRDASYLDLSDTAVSRIFPLDSRLHQNSRSVLLERDLARVHARRFGFPILRAPEALDSLDRFLILASAIRVATDTDTLTTLPALVFPRHRVIRLEGRLLQVERVAGPRP